MPDDFLSRCSSYQEAGYRFLGLQTNSSHVSYFFEGHGEVMTLNQEVEENTVASLAFLFPLADFAGSAAIGQAVAVRATRYHSRKGARTRTLSVSSTTRSPGTDVLKPFNDDVEVRNGLGFTSTGIFIPPDIVAESRVVDGDRVEGLAVINFDKKRSTWGWKAISAKND